MTSIMDGIIENIEHAGVRLEDPQKDYMKQKEASIVDERNQARLRAEFDRQKQKDLEEVHKRLQNTQLSYIHQIPALGLDTLQIHDLVFAMPKQLTPPTLIRIDKDMINYRWNTLRTKELQKVTSGHSTARIYLQLYFVGLDAINNGLRRLLTVFNTLPFVYVENSFIRKNLVSSEAEQCNMACSLLTMSVRTEPQTPNVLVADLTLLWFNYKPYAVDFWFRKSWNSIFDAPKDTQAVYDRQILSLSGGPHVPSENTISLQQPLTKSEQTTAWAPPVSLPQNSEPLRELVERHLGPKMSIMDDKVVIKYREYVGAAGISGQSYTFGKINKNLLRDVHSSDTVADGDVLLRLHPDAAEAYERLAHEFSRRFSKPRSKKKLSVSSCYRTREMQIYLQKTKSDVASIGYSWHEVGLAVDMNLIGRFNREQYKWLVDQSKRLGFVSLGASSGHSPYFADGGRWDDGGDPNSMIVSPPSRAVRDSKGRLQNWETWHFDFVPVQTRMKRELGPQTQLTIERLRGMIHYTSSDPATGMSNLVSETGEKTTLEKVEQKDKEAQQGIEARIDGYLNQGYIPDPHGSDPVRILLYKQKDFVIRSDDTELIPQSINFAKSNVIAEIPIMSHEFSTQQYLGTTDLDANISFIAVGEEKLKELQDVISKIQTNGRIAKGVRSAAIIEIDNCILNFGGMKQAMVEKISTSSLPGSPGVYKVDLVLTQAKRKEEKDLNQEQYMTHDAWQEATRWIIQHLFTPDIRIMKDLRYIVNENKKNTYYANYDDPDSNLEDTSDFDYVAPGNKSIDTRQWLLKTLMLLDEGVRKCVYSESKLRWIESPDYIIPYLKDDDVYKSSVAEILKEYANIVGEIIAGEYPLSIFFRLGLEDISESVYQFYSDISNAETTLVEDNIVSAAETATNREANYDVALKKYRSKLGYLWTRIYDEGLYLHPVFAGLYDEMRPIFDQFRRGSECYPDLDLPPDKTTGHSLNTPPDYWFWNESVDGGMFSDYKERLDSVEQFMANSYQSMKQYVNEKEWSNNYICPNKSKIEKDTIGSDSNPRKMLATATIDEAGLPTMGRFEIPGEKVGQVFDELNGYLPPSLNGVVVKTGGRNEDAQIKPDEDFEMQDIKDGYSGRLVDMLKKSMQNFDAEVYRLARAYPTFKVYFMEDDMTDSGRLGIRNFDDFYSYSAIKDIRIVRSRKIPADLCVISITNIHGELDTLAYGSGDDTASSRIVEKFDPLTVNTDQENPFSKLVVLEGSKIQVRLGYANSPDDLETVFNGQVVEVGVSPISPDIMQLVCQSYGVELVSQLATKSSWNNTGQMLSALICSEYCAHFGRFSMQNVFDPAEIRTGLSGGASLGFVGASNLINRYKQSLVDKNPFRNKPQDDNIFAPEFGTYQCWGEKAMDFLEPIGVTQIAKFLDIIEDDREYYPFGNTIWDVFKEMELRHPGCISLPVPYGNRYTMFFGQPTHKYWSRPLSEIERGGWSLVESFLKNIDPDNVPSTVNGFFGIGEHNYTPKSGQGMQYTSYVNKTVQPAENGKVSFYTAKKQYEEYTKWLLKGRVDRYRPFRNYYFLSSQNNIIANNIKASAYGTFNGVELGCMVDNIFKLHVGAFESIIPEVAKNEQQFRRMVQEAEESKMSIFKLKANDNIQEKDTRYMEAIYPNCIEDFYGRRYAVGLLMRSLRDIYKGTIVITGNPKIKPYDVCVLYDDYREIYGPVEVEQVTHIMSQETGFITEIKPDLMLTYNAATTQSTTDAMVHYVSQLYGEVKDRILSTGLTKNIVLGTAATAGALVGADILAGGVGVGLLVLGGYKLIEWTQGRQALIITPVINGVKPLIAGLDGYKLDDIWMSIGGDWNKYAGNAKEGWKNWWERNPFSTTYNKILSGWAQPSTE